VTTPVLYLPTVAGSFFSAITLSTFGHPDWSAPFFGVGVLSGAPPSWAPPRGPSPWPCPTSSSPSISRLAASHSALCGFYCAHACSRLRSCPLRQPHHCKWRPGSYRIEGPSMVPGSACTWPRRSWPPFRTAFTG